MLSSRTDEFGLVHERRDETGETREGSRSEIPGFQRFEPRTSNFGSRLSRISRASRVACLVHLVYPVHLVCLVQANNRDRPNRPSNGLLTMADFFSILLMFQFVSHSAQQMRHAKGLLEGLPCPEKFRDIQDILFPSCA